MSEHWSLLKEEKAGTGWGPPVWQRFIYLNALYYKHFWNLQPVTHLTTQEMLYSLSLEPSPVLFYQIYLSLMVIYCMETKTISQMISNKIFRLIPNRPSSGLWRRPRHTCTLKSPASTHALTTLWYTTAVPRRKSPPISTVMLSVCCP